MSPAYKVLAVVLAAGALFAGGYRAGVGRENDRGTAALAQLQSRWDADREQAQSAAAATAEQNARETQRRLDRQKENDDAQAAHLARAAADLAGARAAGDRVQRYADTLRAAIRTTAGDPAAGPGGSAAGAAGDLLADMFSRLRGAAGELAAYGDAARIAGDRCTADYDALTQR